MNKIKSLQFTGLIALLAVNAVMPLLANDSWSQQIISNLFNTESAKIMSGVTCAAIGYGTAQRHMTVEKVGPTHLGDARSKCQSHRKWSHVGSPGNYEMGEYEKEVVFNSFKIGVLATVAARLGTFPLSASDVIKPVATGMGIIAGSYALGALAGYYSFDRQNPDMEKYTHYPSDEWNFRRYLAAGNAYNFASYATPLVVAGVSGYMIYDRCTRP